MCTCRFISGTDSPFFSSTFSVPTPTTKPHLLIFTTTHFKISTKSVTLYPIGSTRFSSFKTQIKTRAAINDRFVTEAITSQMSFYDLLGIPESGSLLEIKQAYKQLARKYHPDVSPPGQVEEYTRTFIRVQEAYETLSDPRTRALYDRDMARGLHLAFSARKRCNSDEGMEDKSEWKNRWQSQLSELKRRSMQRDARENMSWGARMRRQRNELQDEL